jgi:hypothetical protein
MCCGRHGHDRVQQLEHCREKLLHELAGVNGDRSAGTWVGSPGGLPACVVHAGQDLALVPGGQDDRGVVHLSALPQCGPDGLPVHGVPQAAQDGEDASQLRAVGEEVSQRPARPGEPRPPPWFLPAGGTLVVLKPEQDMDEAG